MLNKKNLKEIAEKIESINYYLDDRYNTIEKIGLTKQEFNMLIFDDEIDISEFMYAIKHYYKYNKHDYELIYHKPYKRPNKETYKDFNKIGENKIWKEINESIKNNPENWD